MIFASVAGDLSTMLLGSGHQVDSASQPMLAKGLDEAGLLPHAMGLQHGGHNSGATEDEDGGFEWGKGKGKGWANSLEVDLLPSGKLL